MSSPSQKNNKNKSKTKLDYKKYKELKKLAMNNIYKRYGPNSQIKYKYKGLIMENLIFNKNSHLVAIFKDYMIWDYIEEFLKRFYNEFESTERVPKFASFYKNYLKFFCIPKFKDIYYNEMIHNFSEKKAELFYNANYRKKKQNESEQKDCGLFEESELDEESESKIIKNIDKTFFNETIKKNIEKYSPINTSMALPESDTKLKPDDSGLLITSSNESSLFNIMDGMTVPKRETKKKEKYRKFKKYKFKYKYLGLIMENLIFNKNTHLVSTFKDYMIWDYIEEFLKRFYNKFESTERIPKFVSFYKNYLKFF